LALEWTAEKLGCRGVGNYRLPVLVVLRIRGSAGLLASQLRTVIAAHRNPRQSSQVDLRDCRLVPLQFRRKCPKALHGFRLRQEGEADRVEPVIENRAKILEAPGAKQGAKFLTKFIAEFLSALLAGSSPRASVLSSLDVAGSAGRTD
jgi:hypothetical protein